MATFRMIDVQSHSVAAVVGENKSSTSDVLTLVGYIAFYNDNSGPPTTFSIGATDASPDALPKAYITIAIRLRYDTTTTKN